MEQVAAQTPPQQAACGHELTLHGHSAQEALWNNLPQRHMLLLEAGVSKECWSVFGHLVSSASCQYLSRLTLKIDKDESCCQPNSKLTSLSLQMACS